MSEHVDNILSGKVERKHYQKEVEIWANDCIASYNILADPKYPYQFRYKDLAQAIDRYNLDMNVLEQRNKELEQALKEAEEYCNKRIVDLSFYTGGDYHSNAIDNAIKKELRHIKQLLKGGE